MDQERVIASLEWWIEHAEAARSRGTTSGGARKTYDFGSKDSPKVIELGEREDQTRRILHRVLGLDKLPVLLRKSSDIVILTEGIDLCRYALGRLRTDAETREIIGTTAPTMAADNLHETIWGTAHVL